MHKIVWRNGPESKWVILARLFVEVAALFESLGERLPGGRACRLGHRGAVAFVRFLNGALNPFLGSLHMPSKLHGHSPNTSLWSYPHGVQSRGGGDARSRRGLFVTWLPRRDTPQSIPRRSRTY